MTTDTDDTAPVRAEGLALCFDAPAEVGHRTWNQIARFGEFRGHPQGAFRFGPGEFSEIIANFRATTNQRVPVDYEHTSETLPQGTATDGVPAVAWIVDLDDRGEAGLWAAFEWVDSRAVEHVRAKRYLYVSPAVRFNARDKQSGQRIGARLTSVALTNHPFLDGLAPLTASDTAVPGDTTDDVTRMGLSPGAVHIPAGVGSQTEPTMADEPTDLDTIKKKLMSAEAACAEMRAASEHYAALRDRMRTMADAMSIPEGEARESALLDVLQGVVDQLKKQQAVEAASLADRAIAAGRCAPEGRDDLVALCLSDRPRFDRMHPAAALEAKAEPVPPPPARDERLLTARVGDDAAPPRSLDPIDPLDHLAESREVYKRAEKLLSDNGAKSFGEAVSLVTPQVRDEFNRRALASMSQRA